MAQPTRKEPTIEEVRARIETAFAPDIEITWDARANGYRMLGVTDHGQHFIDEVWKKSDNYFEIIHYDQIDEILQEAGQHCLTVQLVLDEEEEEF